MFKVKKCATHDTWVGIHDGHKVSIVKHAPNKFSFWVSSGGRVTFDSVRHDEYYPTIEAARDASELGVIKGQIKDSETFTGIYVEKVKHYENRTASLKQLLTELEQEQAAAKAKTKKGRCPENTP